MDETIALGAEYTAVERCGCVWSAAGGGRAGAEGKALLAGGFWEKAELSRRRDGGPRGALCLLHKSWCLAGVKSHVRKGRLRNRQCLLTLININIIIISLLIGGI